MTLVNYRRIVCSDVNTNSPCLWLYTMAWPNKIIHKYFNFKYLIRTTTLILACVIFSLTYSYVGHRYTFFSYCVISTEDCVALFLPHPHYVLTGYQQSYIQYSINYCCYKTFKNEELDGRRDKPSPSIICSGRFYWELRVPPPSKSGTCVKFSRAVGTQGKSFMAYFLP